MKIELWFVLTICLLVGIVLLIAFTKESEEALAQSWAVAVFQDSLAMGTTEDSLNLHIKQFEYSIWSSGNDLLVKIAQNDTTGKPSKYIKIPAGTALVIPGTASRKIWYKAATDTGAVFIIGKRNLL